METYLHFSVEQTEISQNLMCTNMLYCTFVKLANHIINHSCPILNSTQYSINFCPTKKYIIHKCCATKKKKKTTLLCGYKDKYVIQDIDKKNIPSNSLAALV
jgi:hypothetical protein